MAHGILETVLVNSGVISMWIKYIYLQQLIQFQNITARIIEQNYFTKCIINHSIWILQVFREAERCLNTLSVRLGDEDFFFGSHPTSLDATVYAYLAPLLKVPFPSPALQNHLKSTSNLVKFVVRITQRYFPYSIQGMYYQKWNLIINILLMRRKGKVVNLTVK